MILYDFPFTLLYYNIYKWYICASWRISQWTKHNTFPLGLSNSATSVDSNTNIFIYLAYFSQLL